MFRLSRLYILAFTCFLILLVPEARSQTTGKKKVNNQSDLPRFTYPLTGSASDLLQADAASFNPFAAKVKADLDSIFRDYDIEGKATLRRLLSARLNLQQAAGENQLALETLASLLEVAEKPTDSLDKRLQTKPLLLAAIETNTTSGPAFEQAFRKYYREAWDAVPLDVAQDISRSVLVGTATYNSAVLIGQVKAELDPAVQRSGVLDNGQAWLLIGLRNTLRFSLPLEGAAHEVLRQYVADHKALQADIWQAREVTFAADEKLTPVIVGIWDTGVDVSVFAGQLFSDPHPTASGNHGAAFDDTGNPSAFWLYAFWLYPLTEA